MTDNSYLIKHTYRNQVTQKKLKRKCLGMRSHIPIYYKSTKNHIYTTITIRFNIFEVLSLSFNLTVLFQKIYQKNKLFTKVFFLCKCSSEKKINPTQYYFNININQLNQHISIESINQPVFSFSFQLSVFSCCCKKLSVSRQSTRPDKSLSISKKIFFQISQTKFADIRTD